MGVLRFQELRHSNVLGYSAFHTEIFVSCPFDPSPLKICLTRITKTLTSLWRTFSVLVLTGFHIVVLISFALSPM